MEASDCVSYFYPVQSESYFLDVMDFSFNFLFLHVQWDCVFIQNPKNRFMDCILYFL